MDINTLNQYKAKVKQAVNYVNNAERELLVKQTDLKHLKEQEEVLKKEILEKGYDPNNLTEIIADKEAQLNEVMNKLDEAMNTRGVS